jgi:hypothetical protein
MSVSFLVLVVMADADAGFIPTVGFGRTVGAGRRRKAQKPKKSGAARVSVRLILIRCPLEY